MTPRFEVYEDRAGHWWWLLHGERGPIAIAEAALASEAAAWRECAEVKRAADEASIKELHVVRDRAASVHGHGDIPKPMRDRLFVALLMALLDAGYTGVTVELLARMLDVGLRNYSRFDVSPVEKLSEA